MKRSALYGLALAFLAWSAPALAQPVNLPANTVYGRMGIDTGPGQAIPFGTLATQFGAAADPSSAFAKSIDDYGASPANSGAANLTAIQAAFDATPAGGTIYVKRAGYAVAGTLIINRNIKVLCANTDVTVGANLIETTTSANLLAIRSGYVTVDGCSLAMAGTPTGSATGIIIGDDAVRKTNGGSFTNGSATLNCSTCAFTSADVGKRIYANNVGPAASVLFSSISAVLSGTQVTMATTAGATQAANTFSYGFDYQEIVLRDVQAYNWITGINIVAATQFHIRHAYALGTSALLIQNILWGDQGDGEVTEGTFIGSVAGSNSAVSYHSGGGLRFVNNKVLAQAAISACVQVLWDLELSVGPFMTGNSIEGGCAHGIEVSGTTPVHGGIITGNEIGVSGTGIFAAPTVAHPAWTFTANLIRTVSSNAGISLANMTGFNADNNTIQNSDGGGSGTGYVIASTSSGAVRVGSTTQSFATISNASTSVLIDDQQGLTFAKLPSVAANGSRIFVTDGAPNTSPCTGSSTGATAFRQNGAWTCGAGIPNPLPVLQGGTGDTTLGNHSVLIGQGTGAIGWAAAMTDGQLLVGQTGADPVQRTVTGDVTISAAGATTIGTQTTWTPTLNGSTGGTPPTLSAAVGSYEKVGRTYLLRFTIAVSAANAPTGNMRIGGLPASATATANDNGGCTITYMSGVTLSASYTVLTGVVAPSATNIDLYEIGSGQAGQAAAVAKFGVSTVLEGVCNYHT